MSVPALEASLLAACSQEPIRVPGAIQPHGALVVLDPERLEVRHASANAGAVLGCDVAPGRTLDDGSGGGLAAELRRWLAGDDPTLLRTLPFGGRPLQVLGHRTDQGIVLEIEEAAASDEQTLEGLYPRLRRFLDAITRAPDVTAIAEVAVAELRALTGFNRTLLYAFDEKGDGQVLAESNDGVLPSYRGQRFPASDIPAQARELYRLNRLRLIADADYTPVPITPAISPVDGRPLDLSQAALRSVSPVHLEYMRNMGTGSSMSVSILVDGQLWGLVSAHGRAPHRVGAQVRTACDMLGQILSLQIEARQQAERTGERLRLKVVETGLLTRLSLAASIADGLVDNAEAWMALTGADGAAVVTGAVVRTVGAAPDEAAIRRIVARLSAQATPAFKTESMAGLWPEAAAHAETASGLMAISISQLHDDYILWFRREVVRTIEWSGDPAKPVIPGSDRLHPRTSFEVWREQVRATSRSWTAAQADSAEDFRRSIQDFVLRQAEERAELSERLEQVNKELESFSYSISHDLRAPFRHIVGYSELLAERAGDLDERSRHYLRSITESALAAGQLVDDLLRFSQLGRASLDRRRIDMNKLVEEVRRGLAAQVGDRAIDWTIETLPDAWGDGAMVRQVLQNLIENAIKYSAPRELAAIAVRARPEDQTIAYSVSDNGVGFEMAYAGKLFGVFQRLHRVEDFEGTGIGLALVKRIVERHGGTVRAHGEPGKGAEFTFTLPQAKGMPTRG